MYTDEYKYLFTSDYNNAQIQYEYMVLIDLLTFSIELAFHKSCFSKIQDTEKRLHDHSHVVASFIYV